MHDYSSRVMNDEISNEEKEGLPGKTEQSLLVSQLRAQSFALQIGTARIHINSTTPFLKFPRSTTSSVNLIIYT